MTTSIKPSLRAAAIGAAAATALIGSFLLGSAGRGSATTTGSDPNAFSTRNVLTSAVGAGRITVTGTGTVTGIPNQLVLSMGVQVNAASVSSALQQANGAANRVIAALGRDGVPSSGIQTSDLSIQPNYRDGAQVPVSYGVSEQLTATLGNMARAGSQIQDAVKAGGNAVVVNGVSLNLTDTGGLLKRARAAAVRDAQAKATQFASALHQNIEGVISVSDQTSMQPPLPFAAAGALKSASVPVSPGTEQVSVQISIIYAIG